ncbi:transcription antitermination factor NusB [Liquorilactobacillus sicerae]|uniref:transcription antitermination factor NusB n=1 Tax=Liquorilactobacillus sicerae TaxID=1416943 RepID=UPI00247FA8B4|nr:transcription antitermination factor NusB [Liquorilactobacillus sicerae]
MKRSEMRQVAFQILFAWESNSLTDSAELYQQLHQANKDMPAEMPAYLNLLIEGVQKNLLEINQVIIAFLKQGWSLERLNKTDLVIMQIAVFEIKFITETPDKVAVNEAIELAKKFSDEKSRRFINGILSNLIVSN